MNRDIPAEISLLLENFNSQAEDSRALMQQMLDVISSGRAPQNDAVRMLNQALDQLRAQYDSICSAAEQQLTAEEMPEAESPAGDYVEAVRSSAAAQYQARIAELRAVLEEFSTVQSLVARYADALHPFQEQAKELIAQLQRDDAPALDDVERKTEGPQVFLQTLACGAIDSDEKFDLIDQSAAFYPDWVQRGLAADKYFLPTSQPTEEPVTNDLQPDDESASQTNMQPTDMPADELTSTAEALSTDEPQSAELTEPATEPSAFVQAVQQSGILQAGENLGELTVERSPHEDKKISVSVFQNELRKIGISTAKNVLELICKRGSIVSEYVQLMTKIPQNIAENTLDALCRRGYLRRYTITPGGCFWCASPRLQKAITFQDAAKLIGVRQRPVAAWGESIEDKASSAVTRLACSRLLRDGAERILSDGGTTFLDTGSQFTEAGYSLIFPTDKSKPGELMIAVFWENVNECDLFLDALKKALEQAEQPIGRVIFCALNEKKAALLATLLSTELKEHLHDVTVYLYSFEQNTYFTDSLEMIESPTVHEQKMQPEEELSAADERNEENAVEEPTEEISTDEKENDSSADELAATDESETVSAEAESEPAAEVIESLHTVPTPAVLPAEQADVFRANLMQLINAKQFYAAAVYARVQAKRDSNYARLYDQLAYALNDPLAHCSYTTDNAFDLIEQRGVFEDALVLSAALRTFFSNQVRYDYQIKPFYSGIREYDMLTEYPELSGVLYTLMSFKDSHHKGLDAYADYHSKTKTELETQMHRLQHDAQDFYENFIVGRKKERASQKRFLKTKELIFAVNNDIGQYIRAIFDGDTELQPLGIDFLQKEFYKEGSNLTEDTIDSTKLWNYITEYWEKAGDQMTYRINETLKSHLRSNIISITTKAVQLIAKWCNLVERMNSCSEDAGDAEYKKIRQPLMGNIDISLSKLENACAAGTLDPEAEAGQRVLIFTLDELRGCIDGTGDEDSRRYFYVPFLLTDEVMLNEDFLPDLDMHSSVLHSLDPMQRILVHGQQALPLNTITCRERLSRILEIPIDNYGTARLLVQYLTAQGDTADLDQFSADIDGNETYARENVEVRKKDFIGELELAQSYGQIDNSVEDKKEKILQIVEEWYEWAEESADYAFFKRVMDGYLTEIRETAKSREADLLEQLEKFRAAPNSTLSVDAKKARIARIENMIHAQNYTVAEDLLRRDTVEDDCEKLREEDFLREFLDHFNDYYQPVAASGKALTNLLNNPRNKEMRGAHRLADNWLPGGGHMGKDRLMGLLTSLGFPVESVHPQKEERFEQFIVHTKKTVNGRRIRSTHPIAAFGSSAAEEGFRVICLNGNYDADKLINVMKQCGTAKHTLILLDCALTLPEHRRLARKTKKELNGDKMFGVIDRTIMMFLMRNFDETKINRMLMALITPFAYYQPYVWKSSDVMPPEIFMGRRRELEEIESATGVNIVYGGRQLGKSALLKKAKIDINKDENGNRAVLVDIKGLNYRAAAKKIAEALFDEGVLTEELRTESWDELARAVKRRLKDEEDRIPYLLLLLDEADKFIESCGEVDYHPFDALKDIQSIGVGRFKFVIAGLHNIVRFKRETALSNNSVLTHLETMTVKPFTTPEARELLEVPLHYLGLQFPQDQEALITLILATTNYFPGLIQLYCAKLIGAMRSDDYANYSETDTPIYKVSEEHIKKVLADADFNQQIREKYLITLRLDEDNYYYLIALLMASLYHTNGYSRGYSAADIKKAGENLLIGKIASLEDSRLEALMEELCELNVLRCTDEQEHYYLFARFAFFQMIGKQPSLDDELEKYMGE